MLVSGRQREPEDGTGCGSNAMTWTTLTGILLWLHIRPQSINLQESRWGSKLCPCPSRLGLEFDSFDFSRFAVPYRGGFSTSRSRFKIRFEFDSQIGDCFAFWPHRGPKVSFFVLFFVFFFELLSRMPLKNQNTNIRKYYFVVLLWWSTVQLSDQIFIFDWIT